MKTLLTLAAIFAVGMAATGPAADAQPAYASPGYAPPPGYAPQPVVVQQEYCREYSDTFRIGQEVRKSFGTACLQPDGSWQIRSSSAALNYVNRGGSLYVVPAQPFASFVIVDRHHPHYHDHY